MPEAPEIPEAKDPFEKRAAVTIAILAVVLAIIGNKGDDSKTEAIIKTNEAANGYAYFQAKGIKGSIASAQAEMLVLLAPSQNSAAEIPEKVRRLKEDAARYKEEQVDIKKEADREKEAAAHFSAINNRCDRAALGLQIAIVIASVSILARSHAFWLASLVLGLLGLGIGLTAFFL